MERLCDGGAGGPGGLSGSATIPPPFPATQKDVDDFAKNPTTNLVEIRSIIARVLRTPGLDTRPLLALPPLALAKLSTTPEWLKLLDAMMVLSVVDKKDRYTRSQWRAINYFKKNAARDDEDRAIPIDVEVQPSGRSPMERELEDE